MMSILLHFPLGVSVKTTAKLTFARERRGLFLPCLAAVRPRRHYFDTAGGAAATFCSTN